MSCSIQKSKQTRCEQPAGVIHEQLVALLGGHGAPFQTTCTQQAITLECASSELLAWLRSAAFAPLVHLVSGAPLRRLSADALVAEDAALEARCADAYNAIAG